MPSMAYDLYNQVALNIMGRMNQIEEILAIEHLDHVDNLHEVLTCLCDKLNVSPLPF
ncbi:uncharacterized protein EI90DRAFT_3077913 [Cantharellus anzutake]|uniref:uncharacterized protein n=1 Tax=Cantharellus anzutake TaxID=1750568 RepID=UPI001907F33F|nr:uncharacterized protein EI90DRAFT_3077913 [Cantharellus anzutake]KAF8322411.1 hypothetical protein EI90DRAFT_3077913 [Cantharellus anzutake]